MSENLRTAIGCEGSVLTCGSGVGCCRFWLILAVSLLACPVAFAMEEPTAPAVATEPGRSFLRDDQRWTLEIPVWIPGFRGTFAYGDVSLAGEDGQTPEPVNPIEPEPDDPRGNILSRLFSSSTYLKFVFMGRVAYSHGRIHAQIDAFTGHLGESVKFRFNEREVAQANLHSTLARAFVGYSVFESSPRSGRGRFTIRPFAGTRVHFFSIDSDLNGIVNRLDLEHTWAEMTLGIEMQYTLRRWLFLVQGDWGNSFAEDSNSYMFQALLYWRMSGLMSFKIGWADWRVDVERRVLGETMTLYTHLSGPSMGLGFHF